MTLSEAKQIIAEPVTMYGTAMEGKNLILSHMTQVPMGTGENGSGWACVMVDSVPYNKKNERVINDRMTALNIEIAARRTEAKRIVKAN